MRFVSTRGGAGTASFEEVISRGYAPDGGLYVPEALPRLTLDELQRWRGLNFADLAETLFLLFVGSELGGHDELRRLVHCCYEGFSCKEIVPVRRVGGLHVAELFHGPTFCFKDLGQQPLVRMLAHFAKQRGIRRTMLVNTTGDTGPAAMRAVTDSGSSNLDILVFFPQGQISDLQRRQMTTVASDHAQVSAFEGGGDDMDLPLKRLAADRQFAAKHGLCGLNSYNLGRPLAQTVHFFWTYFRTLEQRGLNVGAQVDVVVPSGALGNLSAAYMAKKMGLPLGRLVAATNSNDITHRTISAGEFHRSQRMEKTLSDALNIQVPYNMERIFYYLTGEDHSLVSTWMQEMEHSGQLNLPAPWLTKMQEEFSSSRVDDQAMCAAVRTAVEQHGYLADPHTAVALAAAGRLYGEEGNISKVPAVVMATASPCKFEVALTEALGAERWSAYLASTDFPKEARAVLSASEGPCGLLKSQGSLVDSQDAWEAEVRRLLTDRAPDSSGGGGKSHPASRL